jgi:RNA polymerase sigma-70 factor, ECF subfamily
LPIREQYRYVESDDALVGAARRADESAFLALYQRHRDAVYRFAYRLTVSVQAAEDITQECFLVLLRGARFDARQGTLRTYLLGVARHLAIKRFRRAERESDEIDEVADQLDPLQLLLATERAAMVQEAVSALPLLQREALILFEYEELSLEEIATVTGADPGAVKARLYRARQSLLRLLDPLLGPCPGRNAYD